MYDKDNIDNIEFANRILNQRNSLSENEVDEWMNDPQNRLLLKEIARVKQSLQKMNFDKYRKEELAKFKNNITQPKRLKFNRIISVAASIVIILGVSLFVFRGKEEERIYPMVVDNVGTTTFKAELLLDNGEVVLLTSENRYVDAELNILNDSANGLSYVNVEDIFDIRYNTLRVPTGGFYKLELADGTVVWLNAASEIKYPVSFNTDKREVFLSGEAYFDVNHNPDMPFIVHSHEIQTIVLGTTFNVKAYPNENEITTTLVSGKVQVVLESADKEIMLSPGKSAQWDRINNSVKTFEVNTDNVIAWKDGWFIFTDEDIEVVFKMMARWYDVEFEFENEWKQSYTFNGRINKDNNLENTLNSISLASGLRFIYKDNKIIVIE